MTAGLRSGEPAHGEPRPQGGRPAAPAERSAGTGRGLLSFYDRLRERMLVAADRRHQRYGKPAIEAMLLVPDVFILLVRLALDRRVPAEARALIGGALAYFVLPLDLGAGVDAGEPGHGRTLVAPLWEDAGVIPRRLAATAAALLVGLSCATVRESGRVPAQDEGGGVRAAIFADDRARDAHALYHGAIAGTLERRDGDGWRPLFRSLDSSWTVAGLEPGRYRLRFDAALDARGEESALERPLAQTVEVRRGEIVEVEAVLDHVSPAAVAAGAAAVIVAAVLLHEWLDDFDLPTPPRPPAWAVQAAFYVTLDLATDAAVWVPRQRSPQVTSHFPRAGERVAPGPVRVIFALSEPIDPQWLGDDEVEVETAEGLQLAGRLAWDERRWWLTWEPVVDLPAGARLHVVLRGDRVLDPAGLPLGPDYHFEFETADEDGD